MRWCGRATPGGSCDPKLDQIEAAGIDYVVAVNPGCLRQLRQGLRRRKSKVRAVHIADLLRLAAR